MIVLNLIYIIRAFLLKPGFVKLFYQFKISQVRVIILEGKAGKKERKFVIRWITIHFL